jgi:hypothetical protein
MDRAHVAIILVKRLGVKIITFSPTALSIEWHVVALLIGAQEILTPMVHKGRILDPRTVL